jgi:ACS family tartrate transporter-like MFS transporter
MGLVTYLLLPNGPRQAKFLTAEEKESIEKELKREEQEKLAHHPHSVARTLTNRRVLCLAAIYFGLMIGTYTLTLWGPQLVKSRASGFSNSAVGLLVMLPNLVGLVALLLVSRSSDRRGERRFHVAIPAVIAGLALVLLGTTHSPFLSEGFLTLLAVGVYGSLAPFWALPSEFLTGTGAAAGIALVNSVGNLGGFVGPYAIGALTQRTGSLNAGLAVPAVCLFVAAVLALVLPRRKM